MLGFNEEIIESGVGQIVEEVIEIYASSLVDYVLHLDERIKDGTITELLRLCTPEELKIIDKAVEDVLYLSLEQEVWDLYTVSYSVQKVLRA